jgi:hypothetical protein
LRAAEKEAAVAREALAAEAGVGIPAVKEVEAVEKFR